MGRKYRYCTITVVCISGFRCNAVFCLDVCNYTLASQLYIRDFHVEIFSTFVITVHNIENIKIIISSKYFVSGNCQQVLDGHTDEIFSCVFNYEGDTILTGSKDNTCRIWR